MLTKHTALQIAYEWIAAWNSHDLDKIMEHYADTIVFQSPFVVILNNDPNGIIANKENLRSYFAKALEKFPDLYFDLHKILVSINSIVIYYTSVNQLFAAEYMEVNEAGLVTRVAAHYSE